MPIDIEAMVNEIDVSALSLADQEGFKAWLRDRPQMQTSINSTLQKGQSVWVSPGRQVAKKPEYYFVPI